MSVPAYCGTLGKSSKDTRPIRLYTKSECDTLDGNFHSNGECTKKTGGSFSWDCGLIVDAPVAVAVTASAPKVSGAPVKNPLLTFALASKDTTPVADANAIVAANPTYTIVADTDGRTPLMIAVSTGCSALVAAILSLGSPPPTNFTDVLGTDATQLAREAFWTGQSKAIPISRKYIGYLLTTVKQRMAANQNGPFTYKTLVEYTASLASGAASSKGGYRRKQSRGRKGKKARKTRSRRAKRLQS